MRLTADQRFFSKVERGSIDECWKWTGNKMGVGYGGFWPGYRRPGKKSAMVYAHRWIYERATGEPIPEGMVIDHVCRNRGCVNPLHLRVVTHRQNSLENSLGRSAIHAAKTHCVNGHPFDEENTYLWSGSRHCKACRAAVQKAKRENTCVSS